MGLNAIAAALAIAVTPMHVAGVTPKYPRLVNFSNQVVMARVNARMAALEKKQHDGYPECVAGLHKLGENPASDDYWADITVGYISSRFLSFEILVQYNCGGAHPNNGSVPVTFDLLTGREIDWTKAFRPTFWSNGIEQLYRKHYPWTVIDQAAFEKSVARGEVSEDDNCKKMIDGQQNFPLREEAIFRLQKKHGLMLQPDFPHVIQACAEEVALPASELKPYLKDPALWAELRSKEFQHDR